MITDGKIRLVAPEREHIDAMYRWENDRSVWPDGRVRAPMSRQLLWDFVTNYNPDIYQTSQARFVVQLCASSEAIGAVDLYDFSALDRRAGVSVVIDVAHRGNGYSLLALDLLADYGRRELGLHQLWAVARDDNSISREMFQRAGYVACGHLRSWVRMGSSYVGAYIFQKLL